MGKALNSIKKLLQIIHTIQNSDSLEPQVAYELWKKIEDFTDEDSELSRCILSNSEVKSHLKYLRSEYAKYLVKLEMHFAKKCLSNQNGLEQFQKYQQYFLRAKFEISNYISLFDKKPKNALMCGCGPLPISAIIISNKNNIKVDLLDFNPKCLDLAAQVVRKYGARFQRELQFFNIDLLEYKNFSNYDVIFIAGTVGETTKEKKKIIRHILSKISKNTVIIVREPYYLDELLIANSPNFYDTNTLIYTLKLSFIEDCVCRKYITKK